jgi:outer membrane protein W
MKTVLKLLLIAAIATILTSAPLSAQDAGWSKYNYGIQIGMLVPSGDLQKVAENGFGAAAYMEKIWSNFWAVRGRLEYISFGEKEYGYGVNTKVGQIGAMLDAIYYMEGKDVIYPFFGVGYFKRSMGLKTTGASVDVPIDSEFALCVGLGWNFTKHLGVEFKYSQCEFNWMQFSVLYRF